MTTPDMVPTMPGAFFDVNNQTFKEATCHAIFQPPRPMPRTERDRRHESNDAVASRPKLRSTYSSGTKRPRINSTSSTTGTLQTGPDSGSHHMSECQSNITSSTLSLDAPSPAPLVSTKYRLAGGSEYSQPFDRTRYDFEQEEEEQDWRINRYSTTSSSATASYYETPHTGAPRTPSSSSINSRKRRCRRPSQHRQSGWNIRGAAWALTGGLAGKVINYCWTTAFRGFSAGEGQSYGLDVDTPEVPQMGLRVSQIDSREDVFSNHFQKRDAVPGGFFHPEPLSQHDFAAARDNNLLSPTCRPVSGQNTPSGLRGDWLMVDDTSYHHVPAHGRTPSPVRKKSRATMVGSRCGSRRNSYSSCEKSTDIGSGASVASPRSNVTTALHAPQRRSNSHAPTINGRSTRPSLASIKQHQQPVSYFSIPRDDTPEQPKLRNTSPIVISPEVAEYKRKMRRKERQQDESMMRMNSQLKDMIREAREALGTKMEVGGTEDLGHADEGFFEDDNGG